MYLEHLLCAPCGIQKEHPGHSSCHFLPFINMIHPHSRENSHFALLLQTLSTCAGMSHRARQQKLSLPRQTWLRGFDFFSPPEISKQCHSLSSKIQLVLTQTMYSSSQSKKRSNEQKKCPLIPERMRQEQRHRLTRLQQAAGTSTVPQSRSPQHTSSIKYISLRAPQLFPTSSDFTHGGDGRIVRWDAT